MPDVLDRCVTKVMSQGKSKSRAYGICVASTGWKRKKGGGWTKSKKKSAITEASKRRG